MYKVVIITYHRLTLLRSVILLYANRKTIKLVEKIGFRFHWHGDLSITAYGNGAAFEVLLEKAQDMESKLRTKNLNKDKRRMLRYNLGQFYLDVEDQILRVFSHGSLSKRFDKLCSISLNRVVIQKIRNRNIQAIQQVFNNAVESACRLNLLPALDILLKYTSVTCKHVATALATQRPEILKLLLSKVDVNTEPVEEINIETVMDNPSNIQRKSDCLEILLDYPQVGKVYGVRILAFLSMYFVNMTDSAEVKRIANLFSRWMHDPRMLKLAVPHKGGFIYEWNADLRLFEGYSLVNNHLIAEQILRTCNGQAKVGIKIKNGILLGFAERAKKNGFVDIILTVNDALDIEHPEDVKRIMSYTFPFHVSIIQIIMRAYVKHGHENICNILEYWIVELCIGKALLSIAQDDIMIVIQILKHPLSIKCIKPIVNHLVINWQQSSVKILNCIQTNIQDSPAHMEEFIDAMNFHFAGIPELLQNKKAKH